MQNRLLGPSFQLCVSSLTPQLYIISMLLEMHITLLMICQEGHDLIQSVTSVNSSTGASANMKRDT